jgi:hypothetical protein
VAFLVGLLIIAGAAFWMRLGSGPVYFEGLAPKIAAALEDRIGQGYRVEVGPAIIARGSRGPAISIDGLKVMSSSGQPVLAAPRAAIAVDALDLMFGNIRPASLQLIGLDVRLLVLASGAIAISSGAEPIVLAGAPSDEAASVDAAPADVNEVKVLSTALHNLVDLATSPEGPLAGLQAFSISQGRLVLDDQLRGRTTTFENLDVAFAKGGDEATLSFATDGAAGRWRIAASAAGRPGAPRRLAISVEDLSMDDVVALSGRRETPIEFDMPMSARVNLALGADGAVTEAAARLSLGAGYIYSRDPDAEPVLIDEAAANVHWNSGQRRFEIDNAAIFSGESRLSLSGVIAPPVADGVWTLDLKGGSDTVIAADRPGDKPINLPNLALLAKFAPSAKRLTIDRLDVAGPDVDLSFQIEVGWSEAGPRLKLDGATGRMSARSLIRLWPASIAAGTRGWFIDHLQSGVVDDGKLMVDLGPEAFVAMREDHAVADDAMLVEFRLSDAVASFLPGVPPLSGVEGLGRVTGRTAQFNATRGFLELADNRKLTLSELTFNAPDLEPSRAGATVGAHLVGPLSAVADLLARDGLKGFGGMPIDASVSRGRVDGRVTVDLKFKKDAQPEDTVVKVAAGVTNFSIDKLIGKEKLDQGTLTVTADKTGIRASGQGRMFGAPATIDVKRSGPGPTESTVSVVLDDAARARQGWLVGAGVTGPIAAKFAAHLAQSEAQRAQVEVDLTRAAIDGLLPGYIKPAGRPAKASFTIAANGEGARLDQFSFDGGGGVSVAGAIDLDSSGAVASGRFSQVRLSPGDDMKIELDQSKDVTKLVIRANALDARPFLRKATGADAGAARDNATRDLDLDLKATVLTGANRQAVSNAELRYVGHGVTMRQFSLRGRIGRAAITGQLGRPANGSAPVLSITTTEGGAALSFLDLYRRMEGGNLVMAGQLQDGRIDGYIQVQDFVVRDEPSLRRLVSASPQQDGANARIDATAVNFTRLQVNFSRSPTRLDLRDGVIYGSQIGVSLDGGIDYARDKVAFNGTFVPAYGLNNLFAQIPLFGPIIGGGSHEGLFAVNFQISGAASAPLLQINPLSAIAPGFLRKIFGGLPATQQPTPPAPVPNATSMPMAINPGSSGAVR